MLCVRLFYEEVTAAMLITHVFFGGVVFSALLLQAVIYAASLVE
jgi:hypothetical protein